MKIGILGTGMVGKTLADRLVAIGHDVRMGSRTAQHEGATAWAQAAGPRASNGTFADAAAFGEVVFNCTNGMGALEALTAAGSENLAGKILLDVSNPLDFSKGMPPRLSVCNDTSLAEQIQAAFPATKVVKTLNTVNCKVMADASRVPDTDIFVAGNDAEARTRVAGWLKEWFGWSAPVDLGDITAARGLEMWLPLWIRLMGALKTPDFNLRLVRG